MSRMGVFPIEKNINFLQESNHFFKEKTTNF